MSPLVFDVAVALQREGAADNGCIEAVFGANSATKRMDLATGEVLRINTLFPSKPSTSINSIFFQSFVTIWNNIFFMFASYSGFSAP